MLLDCLLVYVSLIYLFILRLAGIWNPVCGLTYSAGNSLLGSCPRILGLMFLSCCLFALLTCLLSEYPSCYMPVLLPLADPSALEVRASTPVVLPSHPIYYVNQIMLRYPGTSAPSSCSWLFHVKSSTSQCHQLVSTRLLEKPSSSSRCHHIFFGVSERCIPWLLSCTATARSVCLHKLYLLRSFYLRHDF